MRANPSGHFLRSGAQSSEQRREGGGKLLNGSLLWASQIEAAFRGPKSLRSPRSVGTMKAQDRADSLLLGQETADLAVLVALGVGNQGVCSPRSIQDRRLEVLSVLLEVGQVEESDEIFAPEMAIDRSSHDSCANKFHTISHAGLCVPLQVANQRRYGALRRRVVLAEKRALPERAHCCIEC